MQINGESFSYAEIYEELREEASCIEREIYEGKYKMVFETELNIDLRDYYIVTNV